MTAMPDVTSRTFGDLFRLSPEELATCLDDQTLMRSAQDGKRLAKWMAATPCTLPARRWRSNVQRAQR